MAKTLLLKRLLNMAPPAMLDHVPLECTACLSEEIERVELTQADREREIQRRYECSACDQNMLVTQCEAIGSCADNGSAPEAAPVTPINEQAAVTEMSDHEHKISALEKRLALIDQDIANSRQRADEQDADLLRTEIGIADLKNLEAVTAKHTRLLTLLNELHRMHYSKELVLAETEHEKAQLNSHLSSVQVRSSEMELRLRAEVRDAKANRKKVLKKNQELKRRVLSLESQLSEATDAQLEAAREKEAALLELKALRSETGLEVNALNSQLNVVRKTLAQAEITAEREQVRLMSKVRDLESQLPNATRLEQSVSITTSTTEPASSKEKDIQRVIAHSANSDHDIGVEESDTESEYSTLSNTTSQPSDIQVLADKKYRTGVRYAKGKGVQRSELAALSYFEQASRLGHASAQYNLGVLKYKGSLDSRDLSESVYWLSHAAEQGHDKAAVLLPEVEAAYKMDEQQNIAL